MKKIRGFIRMVRVFIRLVCEMIRNYPFLNDDLTNNFYICKKICRKVIRTAGIRFFVEGSENLYEEKPFLLVSNHRCFFDVVFLIAGLDKPVSFVAAKELFSYPVLRRYLESVRCVMLDRYTQDLSVIRDGVSNMKSALAGGNLVLFPEGECSYYGTQVKKFKKGGFVGVSEIGAPVIPAFIHIGEMQNIGRWMIPQGKVKLTIGEGFYPAHLFSGRIKATQLAEYTRSRVLELQEHTSDN